MRCLFRPVRGEMGGMLRVVFGGLRVWGWVCTRRLGSIRERGLLWRGSW